ncbi:helix-turn-helix transcriptional regulator [Arenibacter sp. M-2]|uniref:helix-turn-helix transcriptional regulator n=1 Tax=unclassified Arenibacter TaxID=2615047 RepID=UPI000D76BFA8|nr:MULTISPECIES: helix-turn-helix transcriptional regulator [unclassified Arenibacter]MDL5511410.1 helix-turn-helix transcriptional regulator [Arenibacter sp. M-2]PXX24282.1 helix-turn-helix protein [Arenibacter sp. ARW7G5Y1]|tara:strand:- start:13039 stop:13872 length:834 start_codon:yes stop_codon:yes gene_type:complete
MSILKYTVLPLKQRALEPFVKRISYIENETVEPQFHSIPPIGANGLSFYFGAPMRHIINHETIPLLKGASVLGTITEDGITVIHQGCVKQIYIEFTPTGFYRLFHKHGSKFTNSPPADFSTIDAQMLENELENCSKDVKSIQDVFENYLLRIMPNALPEIPLINNVVSLMQADVADKNRVEDICKKVGVNQRYLSRLFKKVIGMSPKKYYRTQQWNTIMSIINQNKEETLTKWALECGFYDHPSFTKEFKKFMQIPPSEFINGDVSLVQMVLRQNRQ